MKNKLIEKVFTQQSRSQSSWINVDLVHLISICFHQSFAHFKQLPEIISACHLETASAVSVLGWAAMIANDLETFETEKYIYLQCRDSELHWSQHDFITTPSPETSDWERLDAIMEKKWLFEARQAAVFLKTGTLNTSRWKEQHYGQQLKSTCSSFGFLKFIGFSAQFLPSWI